MPAADKHNPLLDGLRIEPTPSRTVLVIFGASGDLTRRKLLPAIYHLSRGQRLPARFAVVGVARTEMSDDGFRQQLHDSLKEFAGVATPDDVSAALAGEMCYVNGEMDDPALYQRLMAKLKQIGAVDTGLLFYLAVPPSVYGTVVEQLSDLREALTQTGNGFAPPAARSLRCSSSSPRERTANARSAGAQNASQNSALIGPAQWRYLRR